MGSDAPLISHISDTARWVAVYRAMETERPDAIFRDPFARRLAGERGEAIVRGMPKGRQMSWPMVVRTAVMDEIIMRCIMKDGVDCCPESCRRGSTPGPGAWRCRRSCVGSTWTTR
jgi:O-methyltransferase involved in polyketide biosynthesis